MNRWWKLLTATLLLLAFFASLVIIFPSGSSYCFQGICGVFFWGAHEHDGVWHLAVANTLFHHFPFQMPNMNGTAIHGYNYLLDIVIASLSYLTHVSVSIWYFKLLPLLWFFGMSTLTYAFARAYRKSSTYPFFVFFFTFFGSSLSYLLRYGHTGHIWGASGILSMQSLQNMLNPQFAWSLLPLLALLIGLSQDKRRYRDYLLYGLLAMIAIGLKFYTGVAIGLILAADLTMSMLKERRQILPTLIKGLIVLGLAALSLWIFYNPGASMGSPFSFKPWATVNPIIEDQSLLYLPKWAERLYNYHGLELAVLELGVLGLFLLCNYGTRILSLLFYQARDSTSNGRIRGLIVIGAVGSLLLSILLIQRGVWWNTVQFLYVSLFLSGLLAAEAMDQLLSTKKVPQYVVIFLLLILTIPTNIDVLHTFLHFPGTSYISAEELSALSYLREAPEGVVLTPLFAARPQPTTLADVTREYDTAYVSAYTGKQTYLSDTIQLELTNINYRERQNLLSQFDCQVLSTVTYLYEYQDSPYVNQFSQCGRQMDRLFSNATVSIYRIH